jgi:hypothetical protein
VRQLPPDLPAWRLALALLHAVVALRLQAQESEAPRTRLDVSGFMQLDAIQDLDRLDPAWVGAFRPTKIPVRCPGEPGCGPPGETVLSVRASRLAVHGTVPTTRGALRTWFEFDLFGVASDAGRTTFRLRHAWGELGRLGAGQTSSLFMDTDAFPASVEYWGPPGLVAIRTAQLRWTPLRRRGTTIAFSAEAPTSSIDVGRAFEADDTLGLRRRTRGPDLHMQWRRERPWGHAQVSAVLTTVGFESTRTADGRPVVLRTGGGLSASLRARVAPGGHVVAQATTGRGIAGYVNEGGVDLAPAGTPPPRPRLVPSRAWSLYWEQRLAPTLRLVAGASEHRQSPSALQDEFALVAARYASVDLRWDPDAHVTLAAAVQHGERVTSEAGRRAATRLQFTVRWRFDTRGAP